MKLRSTITGKVVNASGQVPTDDAKYKINDIALEYEIITQPISTKYQSMVLYYDRILRHRQIKLNKLDTT